MTLADPVESLTTLVSEFPTRHALVLGDCILDEYLHGDCSRISPEAPVPVLRVTDRRHVLGGAGNTAANIVSLGGRASLITLVGDDEGGATMRACAGRAGVDLRAVESSRTTLRKTRVVGQRQQIVRLDYEDRAPASPALREAIREQFHELLSSCDIVVISDYAKGFLSPDLAQALIRDAHDASKRVIVDPRPQNRDCYIGCDYVTPNWREARDLLGLPDAQPSASTVFEVARDLRSTLGANVVLTLGAHGIAFCGRTGEEFELPTVAREVFDVSGAGDTVVAAFALAVAAGADHKGAVSFANRAAGVVVGKFGTATVTPREVLEQTGPERLVSRHALPDLAANLRAQGKRIVTLNGSFDLLHGGHLHILSQARQRGDVLIVALNSDASVKSYKGADRPIVGQAERARMLLALRMVDYVHIFDEPDPIAFVRAVKPDVHVNGSEYGDNCIESEAVRSGGGTLHIVNRIPGLSTTGLLASLQAHAPGS